MAERNARKDLLAETQGCLEETENDIKAFEAKIKEWTKILNDLYINRRRLVRKIKELQTTNGGE